MESTKAKYHGSVVALEGPSDTISTQLHLLPAAPHVLILPNVQSYMKDEGNRKFSARRFVQKVHEAAAARHDAALQFLEQATAEHKRLVFMNGGTVGAQALCVAAISKNETDGDLVKADSTFRGLVKNGLQGLPRRAVSWSWRRSFQFGGDVDGSSHGYEELGSQNDRAEEDSADDPITRAMRAADALDRETESLQPPNQDIDLTFERRTRRYSLPIFDFAEKYKGLDPFNAFEDSMGDGPDADHLQDGDPQSAGHGLHERVEMSSTVCRKPLRIEISIPPPTPSSAEEINEFDAAMLPLPSPFSDTNSSNPQSPERVVYGEARLVQMRSSPSVGRRKRARSLDRVFLSCEREAAPVAPSKADLLGTPEPEPESEPAKVDYQGHRKRPSSCMNVYTMATLYQPKSEYLEVPKTVFVKATPTTISRSATGASRGRRASWRLFGDHDIEANELEAVPEFDVTSTDDFETVLPLREDLSIRLSDGSKNELMDLVFAGFKDGNYPVVSPPVAPVGGSMTSQEALLPPVPSSSDGSSSSESSQRQSSDDSPVQEKRPNADSDEYDPFAPHGSYGYPVATWLQKGSIERLREAAQLPTPAQTPPPTNRQNEQRFYTLSTVGQATPVLTQNALRSVLAVYFPPQDKSYHRSQYPVSSEMESLWRPVFRDAVLGSKAKDEGKIDLILAIGAQAGVRKEYASAITGQIEKLGTKPSGLSRSGRIDLRYLIANVMQTRMMLPNPTSAREDSLLSKSIMATLLVWHLDVYFATNSDVRFLLLEYPEEHFATVLALQRLVGSDVMKVAGILDGDDPVTVVPSRVPSRRKDAMPNGNTATAAAKSDHTTNTSPRPGMPSPQASSDNRSFAKSNFLLTSNATDSEIATFISTIWKILISVSEFYIPEHAPRKVSSGHSLRRAQSPYIKATPLDSPNGEFIPSFPPQVSLDEAIISATWASPTAISPPHSPTDNLEDLITIPALSPMLQRSESPSPSVRSAKSGRSVRTSRTTSSARDRLKSLRRRGTMKSRNGGVDEKDSVQEWDSDGEEDYDVDERRLMPLFTRPAGRKANTRKALKWLGLA